MNKQIHDGALREFIRKASLSGAFLTLAVVSFSLLDTLSSSVVALPTQNEASYTAPAENDSSAIKNEGVISVVSPVTDMTYYTVREHNGMIGIFTFGDDIPDYVLPVYVFTLPEKTVQELAVGITCTEDELYRLLEALSS